MPIYEKLVTIEELAQALGRSEDWIKRRWLKLHLNEGMPRKLPTSWVWPRAAMEKWFESHGTDAVVMSADIRVTIPDELAAIAANENRTLRARYSGGRA